jgi:hypothetical protein
VLRQSDHHWVARLEHFVPAESEWALEQALVGLVKRRQRAQMAVGWVLAHSPPRKMLLRQRRRRLRISLCCYEGLGRESAGDQARLNRAWCAGSQEDGGIMKRLPNLSFRNLIAAQVSSGLQD